MAVQTGTDTKREGGGHRRDRDRERHRETDRQSETQRETETEKQTDQKRRREKQTEEKTSAETRQRWTNRIEESKEVTLLLVFYAQSISTVISGRERRDRDTDRQNRQDD